MKSKKLNQKIRNLGTIAGMRSMSAPAMLSQYLHKHPSKRLSKTFFQFMQTKKTANILKLLAAAEILGDKLPFIPARIQPASLLGRALSGTLVGATLARTKTKHVAKGALLGMGSAVAASYLFYFLRKTFSSQSTLSNIVWGAIEDGLVLKRGQQLLG